MEFGAMRASKALGNFLARGLAVEEEGMLTFMVELRAVKTDGCPRVMQDNSLRSEESAEKITRVIKG